MHTLVNFNGKLVASATPLVGVANRGLRYGDGLFETMKMIDGRIIREKEHFLRLFDGLALLQFDIPANFTPEWLASEVRDTCHKNANERAGRVRLNLFRGNGGLYDPEDLKPNFIIESRPLKEEYLHLNENGLDIEVYPHAKKSCDVFSNLKSNNFLPYVMAALNARQKQLNDCLVLNQHDRICDSTIANVFMIKDGQLYTPPLTEGCVAGITRNHICKHAGIPCTEAPLTTDNLLEADELFLTNAVYGMRWVKSFQQKRYGNKLTADIYHQLFTTISA